MNISKFRDENISSDKLSVFNYFTKTTKNNKIIKKDRVVDRVYNFKDLMSYANDIKQQKLDFEKLINEFETLSNKKFFYLYKQFYQWDNTEIKKEYHKGIFKNPVTHIVKTDDVVSLQHTEGHGRDFSWWYVWYNCAYEIIAEDNTVFENRIYTKQELAELASQNKIIVNNTVIPYGEELNSDKAIMIAKQMREIDLKSVSLDMGFNTYQQYLKLEDINRMYKQNKPAFERIRDEFTKEILINDYKKYMIEYNRVKKEIIDKALQFKKESSLKIKQQTELNNTIDETIKTL